MKELEYPFDSSYIIKNKVRLKKYLLKDKVSRIPVRIAVLGGSTTHDICNFLQLLLLFKHAGVVQWLVYDLAKVEMAVRSRSLAPLRFKLAH